MNRYDTYYDSLERSYRIIRSEERLSIEASIEELCKLLMLKLCFEHENKSQFQPFIYDGEASHEPVSSFYKRYFNKYVPSYEFAGWETQMLSKNTYWKVCEELTTMSFAEIDPEVHGAMFTAFLQKHYSGYLSEYSSPKKLNLFIMDVLGAEKTSSIADPCCGIGGTLVEAASRTKGTVLLKGFDINVRMANTARLHLMMYGYKEDAIECQDMLKEAKVYVMDQYDYVIAHLPQIHQAFSVAGRRETQRHRDYEDCFISQILKMLKPDGMAAIVVSDELIESDKRSGSRRWLYENAKVLNITKFEGLAYETGGAARTYNVIFLKHNHYDASDVCSSAFISKDVEDGDINQIAVSINEEIHGLTSGGKCDAIKYFRLLDRNNWNVTLLYLQEKIGVNYPVVPLRELMYHKKDRINIDSDGYYTQLTVRNKGLGVIRRGEPIKGGLLPKDARYEVRSGQLIVSSLEATRGALGIVPKELDRSVVTRNYYAFMIDTTRVRADYLTLVLCTEPIMRQMSTLNKREYAMSRITLEKMLSVVIPLPSLDEQDHLSKAMMKQVKKIQTAQEELESEQKNFCKELFGEWEIE